MGVGKLLALDQGTTSSRAILFDPAGGVVARAQQEFPQVFPRPGWVEHDPEAIWASQAAVLNDVLGGGDVAALGITNQRETTVVWDRETSTPVYNAIVWQDRRTADACQRLRDDGVEELVAEKTGLLLDPYFSATKLAWILDHVDGARERAEAGKLAFGTIDSWLVWKLTGGARHVTDPSNASRTMLFDIHAGEWDDELCRLFNVPHAMLPEICGSAEVVGHGPGRIPIAGMAGDQQAALFGQACLQAGQAKNTYGTGCFLLMNTGGEAVRSRHRLLTTVAWRLAGETTYALEGSVFVGGAVVQWLRDGLGLVEHASEIEELARSVPDSGDVYLVPAFVGLGAPHWDPHARGVLVGITRGTGAGHVARAALDGIAFQVADILDAMQQDAALPLTELRVDGGASANDLLLQIQADLQQLPVVRPTVTETTARGAAFLAGLGAGLYDSCEEIAALWQPDRRFAPELPPEIARTRRSRWAKALTRSLAWA